MKNTIAQEILIKTVLMLDATYSSATISVYKTNFISFIQFYDDLKENFPASLTLDHLEIY